MDTRIKKSRGTDNEKKPLWAALKANPYQTLRGVLKANPYRSALALGAVAVLVLALFFFLSWRRANPLDSRDGPPELYDVHRMYRAQIKHRGSPPNQLDELDLPAFKVVYSGAANGLQEGTYVLAGRIDHNNPSAILAYEKDAPTQGGWVVTVGGTARKMSAAQLTSALPK
jgi:hypothetical protein